MFSFSLSLLIVIPSSQAHCFGRFPWERFPQNLRKRISSHAMVLGTSHFHPPAPCSSTHRHTTLPLTLALCPRVSLVSHSFHFLSISQLLWASLYPVTPTYPIDHQHLPHTAGVGTYSDKWHARPTSFAWGEKRFKLRRRNGFDWMVKLSGVSWWAVFDQIKAKSEKYTENCKTTSHMQYVLITTNRTQLQMVMLSGWNVRWKNMI